MKDHLYNKKVATNARMNIFNLHSLTIRVLVAVNYLNKTISVITDEFMAMVIYYLKVSGNKLTLLVNFGEMKLNYKTIEL
jgi:PD-(D/E)XK nuclease superfamily